MKRTLNNLILNDQSTKLEVFVLPGTVVANLMKIFVNCDFLLLPLMLNRSEILGIMFVVKNEHENVTRNIKSHRAGDFSTMELLSRTFEEWILLTLFFIIKVAQLCRKNFLRFLPKEAKRKIKLTTNKIMRTNSSGLFASFETCEIKHLTVKSEMLFP